MAIQDRNLSPGTKLWVKYKGQTYTAQVVEVDHEIRYRVEDKDFTSPSGAGSFVRDGKSTNGWSFWQLGPEPEAAKVLEVEPTVGEAGMLPAPPKRRKTTEVPQASNDARESAPPAAVLAPEAVRCAECGEEFPDV